MEDCNTLAADCVIISCCCQCLVLQILVFLLLKLPYKLIQKTKKYAKKKRRKLWHRKKEKKNQYRDEFLGIHGGRGRGRRSVSIQINEFPKSGGHGCCMEEVEKVLEEFSQKGEFAFGSFWGGEGTKSFSTCVNKHECEQNVVQYHIIEMIGSFSSS